MSTSTRLSVLLCTLLVVLPGAHTAADEPLSFDGEHDIGALLRQAGASFDLEHEDAVVLLGHRGETWTADGRRVHSLHSIVYIRTEHGIRTYADLRVAHDSARQTLRVGALRTWRSADQRWITSGPTAVVETLPSALDHASDYTTIRETMLLHDGVELPCVLETAYTIEDAAPFRGGSEGLWTFAHEDPCVVSRFTLAVPAGTTVAYQASPRIPEPERGHAGMLDTYAFTAGPLQPLPDSLQALDDVPHLSWSTWPSWQALGDHLLQRFEAALVVDDQLRLVLEDKLAAARTVAERAELVAKLVAESTRLVDYDEAWFPEPRPAAQTWATAYGHGLDRAVLAAALLREAGLGATPVLRGPGHEPVDASVATRAPFEGTAVWVEAEGLEAVFDPVAAELVVGPALQLGRTMWRPGVDLAPAVHRGDSESASQLGLRLELEHDADAESWNGSAVLAATGALCPFHHMQGLDPERALGYLGRVADALLAGATVEGYNPERFDPGTVTVGFAVTIPGGERDGFGRLPLELADPAAAVGVPLAGELELYGVERRGSILLPGPMTQRLEVHLSLGELEPVYLPEAHEVVNQAGRFSLAVERRDGEVVIVRELELTRTRYEPELWPQLRELLLADRDPRNRKLLLR